MNLGTIFFIIGIAILVLYCIVMVTFFATYTPTISPTLLIITLGMVVMIGSGLGVALPINTTFSPTVAIVCAGPLSTTALGLVTMSPYGTTVGVPAISSLVAVIVFLIGVLIADLVMASTVGVLPTLMIVVSLVAVLFPTYSILIICSGASGGLAQTGQTGQTEGSNIYGSTLYAYT